MSSLGKLEECLCFYVHLYKKFFVFCNKITNFLIVFIGDVWIKTIDVFIVDRK